MWKKQRIVRWKEVLLATVSVWIGKQTGPLHHRAGPVGQVGCHSGCAQSRVLSGCWSCGTPHCQLTSTAVLPAGGSTTASTGVLCIAAARQDPPHHCLSSPLWPLNPGPSALVVQQQRLPHSTPDTSVGCMGCWGQLTTKGEAFQCAEGVPSMHQVLCVCCGFSC